MTYRFDLDFIAPRKGDPSFPPRCHICVKPGLIDRKGFPAVTPLDTYENDIDREIDKLIKELELLRKKAKKKYQSWRKSQKADKM